MTAQINKNVRNQVNLTQGDDSTVAINGMADPEDGGPPPNPDPDFETRTDAEMMRPSGLVSRPVQTNVNIGNQINVSQGDSATAHIGQRTDHPERRSGRDSQSHSGDARSDSRLLKLYALMVSLFVDAWEVRAWVYFNPRMQAIEPFLPGKAVSLAEIIHALIASSVSRNLIDAQFFEDLKRDRPGRAKDIDATSQLFISDRADAARTAIETTDDGRELPVCDVLLVTATTIEARELYEQAKTLTGHIDRPLFLRNTYSYLGEISRTNVYAVRSEMGISTPGGSLLTVRTAISEIRPKVVIMVGIAFGVDPRRQTIGDVLVSTRLHHYTPCRIGTAPDGSPKIVHRGGRVDASRWMLGRFRESAQHWSESKIDFGLIMSGDFLIDNLEFRQRLHSLEPEAVGGEMEGAGLYAAAWDTQVPWILVKSICDWADGRKSIDAEIHQSSAAKCASRFALFAISRGGFRSVPQI